MLGALFRVTISLHGTIRMAQRPGVHACVPKSLEFVLMVDFYRNDSGNKGFEPINQSVMCTDIGGLFRGAVDDNLLIICRHGGRIYIVSVY